MDISNEVNRLLKTAGLYESQGLYKEAGKAYASAQELLEANPSVPQRDALLADVAEKKKSLEATADHVEKAPATQELPGVVQDLIKNLFSASEEKDPDVKALSDAVTLAKFGQTQRAVEELEKLLEKKTVAVPAAKNIIRCHVLAASFDKAIAAYEGWVSEKTFSLKELESIRALLEGILVKKGISHPLPSPSDTPVRKMMADAQPVKSVDMLDIGSVLINFDQGTLKGAPMEFDVNFQTGNTVSLLIGSQEKNVLENLNLGFRLRDVQYRSSVAVFRGDGVVSAIIKVHEGPKQGDYHLDIRIQDA